MSLGCTEPRILLNYHQVTANRILSTGNSYFRPKERRLHSTVYEAAEQMA
jgi:hypothetical protein